MSSKHPSIAAILHQQKVVGISAIEALQTQLSFINETNAQLHCLSKLIEPISPKQGPLTGLGLIHKDIFNIRHFEPGFGLGKPTLVEGIQNARALQKLEDAGAITLGTAVMAPYACGASSQNANFPQCINPLHVDYVVGGSSSGSAVAVASGMTPISLGTDTTGSVRIPAASCGIFGLKTTRGLISKEGVAELSPTLDSVGILGNHLADIELILRLLAESALTSVDSFQKKNRIGLWLPLFVDPKLRQAIKAHLDNFKSVELIEINEFDQLKFLTDQVLSYEANQLYATHLDQASCPRTLKTVCKQGKLIAKSDYLEIINNQSQISAAFIQKYFTNFDVVLLPTFTCTLPNWNEVEIGHPDFDKEKLIGLFHLMGFINYLGIPSLSIPIGLDHLGRPLSIQAIGAPLSELNLIDFAKSILMQPKG
ncbi:amidase [Polynucleobacter rarus]|uniref:amidase n=1 Tax=Polynucleobacter rarus TaxID=556055 RepID=UPI000D3E531A|nr:amidase [Polynucleobacter rarus]